MLQNSLWEWRWWREIVDMYIAALETIQSHVTHRNIWDTKAIATLFLLIPYHGKSF